MMNLYYVKNGAGLYGVPDDTVERFGLHKGAPLVAQGKLEPYDEKRHGGKPGAPPYEEKKARAREAEAAGKR